MTGIQQFTSGFGVCWWFGGRLLAFKENTEALVVASKKIGLDVNVDKI